MLENKQIEIGGQLFEFSPMPVLRAAKLDKKVMALFQTNREMMYSFTTQD